MVFNQVDFEYTGNSAPIDHLIRDARGHNAHSATDLNFEANLRTYAPVNATSPDKPFRYPAQKEYFDSIGIYKGQLKPLMGRDLNPTYREDFAPKNFNEVRTLTNK